MFTKTILAASALISMVTAVPMQQKKRDIKWETSTMWDVTTIDVTTTVWLAPGETAPAGAGPGPAPAKHGHHHKHKVTSHIKSTVTVQPASSSPPEQSPSSPYVAPTPSSPAAPETSTWAATTSQVPPPAPKPSPTKTTTGGSTGTSPAGTVYTGDITHYDVGLGSCGWTNTDSDAIVALPFGMMNNGANPNDNPLCGKMITISYAGSQHQAKVVDTCGGCYDAAIDLSPTLFEAVAPSGDGRVHGVEWWFD